eukprot:scaffold253990_cov31-Tisochrysis_lutea.AAC.3
MGTGLLHWTAHLGRTPKTEEKGARGGRGSAHAKWQSMSVTDRPPRRGISEPEVEGMRRLPHVN